MNFVLIQIIGFLAWIVATASYWFKTKKQILMVQIIGDILYGIHYILLGATIGGIVCVIGLIREICFFNTKNNRQEKILMFIIVPIYLIVGVLTITSNIELLPVVAAIIYCYTLTMATKWMVVGGIIDAVCWLVYDFISGSYSGVFTDVVIIVSNSLSLIKRKKDEILWKR